jgi:predicted RNA-binding Zn-ribbon protein involved in translation (DUF1610 family)
MSEIVEIAEGAKRAHCSNCGAELHYAPGTEFLECGFCGTKNNIPQGLDEIREHDLLEFLNKAAAESEKESHEAVECTSCGSITSLEEQKTAQFCPFCGNHLMLQDASKIEQIKPHAILPFVLSQREAHLKFRHWLGSLWLAPSRLKHMANSPEGMAGIYTPYWTFDAQTASDYTGQRGDDRHVQESYTTKVNGKTEFRTRTKTVTDWRSVSGHVKVNFDDVLILGSRSLPMAQADRLEPWSLSDLVPFNEDYLRGFRVESYKIDLPEAFTTGKERMTESIRAEVRSDIGGDHQRIHSLNTEWNNLTFKHVLLPVWMASYPYNGKTYRFLVNGKTGEVQGERPYSAWKIAGLIIVILIIIAIVLMVTNK